jgi:2-polyprenyl-6-hydroxyphenyl methylase/3-demethylubiquinone-9 3-methyltransferase
VIASRYSTQKASAGVIENELALGERFAFGKNWQQFLPLVDGARIRRAEESLAKMLGEPSLADKTFLDIGCGSGLFSLAARRLGARVHSFDVDPDSVRCTSALRKQFLPADPGWTVEQGSVLNDAYLESLGTFDVVYSWGVLHHTGNMWPAIDAASRRVGPNGKLFIAIYNDLGSRTRRWWNIKRTYNKLPGPLRAPFIGLVMAPEELKALARETLRGRPGNYFRLWTECGDRGMNRWRDMVDWVGGYPYEYATPDKVFEFCRDRGFRLFNLRCGGVGLGCNEFVFERA